MGTRCHLILKLLFYQVDSTAAQRSVVLLVAPRQQIMILVAFISNFTGHVYVNPYDICLKPFSLLNPSDLCILNIKCVCYNKPVSINFNCKKLYLKLLGSYPY